MSAMKKCPQCGKEYEDNWEFCPDDNVPLVEQPHDLTAGSLFAGRFRIIEKIGQGGMGAVYKAIHVEIDRPCAIKLLAQNIANSQDAVARFKREARLASKIDNPHAVIIYDFGQAQGGMLYLAMEYIDGEPLAKVIAREAPLPLDRVIHITSQIAEALSAAHSIGIVHRDLKPENIMLTRKGNQRDYVKVLDFGIAKMITEEDAGKLTQTGFILGTPVYMSPEQLSGEELDPRSDVYSLALIVYEMLSGRLPFEADNTQALMIKRLTSDPIPLSRVLPRVSPEVERVLMAALSRDREQRTASAHQFASELKEAAGLGPAASISTAPISGKTEEFEERQTEPWQVAPTSQPKSPAPQADTLRLESKRGQIEEKTIIESPPGIALPPSAFVTKASDAAAPISAVAQEKPRGPKTIVIISAAMILLLIVATAAAYFIYSRYSSASKAVPPAESNKPASTQGAGEDLARIHYERGKQHQEQAYLIEKSGSKEAADEENRKAISEYRQALAMRPDWPEARENLAVALQSIGDLESALREYETAIEGYTRRDGRPTPQVLTNYGLALFDLKRYSEAARAFGRALELDPNDYDLYVHRGFALHNAGDLEGARADYQRYLERAPSGQYAAPVRQILAGQANPPTASR